MANNNEIRYLNPPTVEVRKKKYCRFKKAGIKYVDYKDAVAYAEKRRNNKAAKAQAPAEEVTE